MNETFRTISTIFLVYVLEPFPNVTGNVALGKEAYLSSKFNESVKWNETSGPACLAVNGNSNSTFRPINRFPDSPNCVHSAGGDERPFWEVDLGQWFPIVGITVIGRDTRQ